MDKYKRNNSNHDNNIDVPKSVDRNAEERKCKKKDNHKFILRLNWFVFLFL